MLSKITHIPLCLNLTSIFREKKACFSWFHLEWIYIPDEAARDQLVLKPRSPGTDAAYKFSLPASLVDFMDMLCLRETKILHDGIKLYFTYFIQITQPTTVLVPDVYLTPSLRMAPRREFHMTSIPSSPRQANGSEMTIIPISWVK